MDPALGIVDELTRFGAAYTRWVRLCIPSDATDRLTTPRISALGVLATQGRTMIMAELADRLGVTSRNVTVLVDGLEREGLVTRVGHPTDRRATMVQVTEEGTALARAVINPHRLAVARLFEEMTVAQQQDLATTLRHLNERLAVFGLGPSGLDLSD